MVLHKFITSRMLKSNLQLIGELYKLREEGSSLDVFLVGIDGKTHVHLPVLIAANPCSLWMLLNTRIASWVKSEKEQKQCLLNWSQSRSMEKLNTPSLWNLIPILILKTLAANTVAKCLPRSMILKRSMALWISKVNVTYTDLSQVKMLSLISTSVSQLLNEFWFNKFFWHWTGIFSRDSDLRNSSVSPSVCPSVCLLSSCLNSSISPL